MESLLSQYFPILVFLVIAGVIAAMTPKPKRSELYVDRICLCRP